LDVSIQDEGLHEQVNPAWEAAFRKCRWFTQGWTLQELIALALVDFYSFKGKRLGNKLLLEAIIHDITSIVRNAVIGVRLGIGVRSGNRGSLRK
jgi:hypothetical protein